MKISDISIRKPVFASMMMLGIVTFGVVLFAKLSVDMFPDVDFPIVTVTTIYPGADPETMESKVAEPIEEAVNSLSGIKMLRSVSLESVTQVFIQFDLDVSLDAAAQDVRDRVAAISRDLPDAAEAPQVEKLDIGAAPIMQLAVHGTADPAVVTKYVDDILKPGLERLTGVGQLEFIGTRDSELHVYFNPDGLRAQGLTVLEVAQALGAQNMDLPGGRITRGGEELVVRTNAQSHTVADLENMVLTNIAGTAIRLRDVARVVDGVVEQRSSAEVDGHSAIAIILRKQSGANTVDVAERVNEALAELESLGPPGTKLSVLLDNSKNIKASIESVQVDLLLGALLAVVIIFIFLRDPRATFISALALPVSVIGTFAFVQYMGFTLNMMTTLALSLSIGILIDDAIVVIENIVRHRTDLKEGPMEAAQRGTAEIGLAVFATTLSIVAVFVPVAFMEGMVGQFFYEFGLTVAFAVMLSLFVSFTLTPMLSARMLKAGHGSNIWISRVIESGLEWVERSYRRVVAWALRHRFITMVIASSTLVGALALVPRLGFEFIPAEDRGLFNVTIELPTGTSLERTGATASEIAAELRELPGFESTFVTVGGGVEEKVNTAVILVGLLHKSERSFSQEDAMAHVRRLLAERSDIKFSADMLAQVSGGGFRSTPIQYNIRGQDLDKLDSASSQLVERLRSTPGFVDVDVTYRGGKPQLNVDVDKTLAGDLGVVGMSVGATVRTLIAGQVPSQFEHEGDRYDIRVQLPKELRQSSAVINRAQVRSTSGALVDIGAIAMVSEGVGPSQIDRQGRQRQVTILANLEGKALGEAISDVEKLAEEIVPKELSTSFSGMGEMMEESVASMGLALFLAIILIYMVLASQFESFVHPVTIMSSLPFSLIGAFGALLIADMRMSIFSMIGVIMLMGLVTKNAILLVDYAQQLRVKGVGMFESLEEAGAVRLRPILMTTGAMIFGMIPVAIGHGDGGEIRAPMGVTVIGGLITSTVLTLVVVPVVYTISDGFGLRVGRIFAWFSRSAEVPFSQEEGKPPSEETTDVD
jgi:HAE1 family hydrophobic/amphiphilic exporter-1